MDRYRVKPGSNLDLSAHDPRDRAAFTEGKKPGKQLHKELNERLEDLQERLYAEAKHKLFIVIQAMDCGGKDGTIRAVFDGTNPQGVKVAKFGKPTHEELAHDYLWRVHQHTPARGEIVLLNHSHPLSRIDTFFSPAFRFVTNPPPHPNDRAIHLKTPDTSR